MNKVVEDYILMQKVGSGQYGLVHRAENRRNKHFYAVKVMNADRFKTTPKLSQFTNNQIAILSKINHPHIIKFIQMLRTANNYYLVYEFCNGGTLAQHIKSKGKLPQNQAIKIFMQLRSAFEVLYNDKILHRDLKPTNILFHQGVIKIADFGFCKELARENDMTQTMVGSPIYMAPQVLKGSIYDSRADLWSMGVILYEMLYGFCPFQEGTIQKLIKLIDGSGVKFPSDVLVSDNIKLLLKRMLTVKYRQRMTPVQFIKYSFDNQPNSPQLKTLYSSASITSFRDVELFIRKSMEYLAQSLSVLARLVDNRKCLTFAFLVFKILSAIQRDVHKRSFYWQQLKIANDQTQWDFVIQSQSLSIQPYGRMVKEAIVRNQTSKEIRLQIETNYINIRYYLAQLNQLQNNDEMKNRLLNCLLISRHFTLVFEKKQPDFTNYTLDKKTLQEKKQICQKFARGIR